MSSFMSCAGDKYAEWVDAYARRPGLILLGNCEPAVKEMVARFPELRAVRGHVQVLFWGKRSHWWTVAPGGKIYDPTADQFEGRVLSYEEWRPGDEVRVGKCMNCGDEIWAAVQSLDVDPGQRSVCDEPRCHDELREAYG